MSGEIQKPTFDKEGYPTEETFKVIKKWSYKDPHGWFDFCKAAMHETYSHIHDYTREDDGEKRRVLILITGGWSGNEDVIEAMYENRMLQMITWKCSLSGGMHTFEWPEEMSR